MTRPIHDPSITTLYKTQISLTEWYAQINHADTEELRAEDNVKRDRLGVIDTIVGGFPFDRPTSFPATDLVDKTAAFVTFLEERGDELCALRLIPLEKGLSKLRMRGHSIREVYDGWFAAQAIDPSKYQADFVPHAEQTEWSTIFVVNAHGIFGEIIRGGHQQLTQGFYAEQSPITFCYDFSSWQLSEQSDEALAQLKKIVSHLLISNQHHRNALHKTLDSTFAHDYLCGYFETVTSSEFGLWFIDYNRVLGKHFSELIIRAHEKTASIVSGQTGYGGTARGTVRIVQAADVTTVDFADGDVLVCDVTTPAYVPLMKKAAAIITDRGGILSHAAIVARELQVPCIVGTGNATSTLKDGVRVDVLADAGTVTLCE